MKKTLSSFILFLFSLTYLYGQNDFHLTVSPDGHSSRVNQLLFTPDGKLISLSEDKSIIIWDIHTKAILHKFFGRLGQGPEGMIYSATLSKDGKMMAYSGYTTGEDNLYFFVLYDLAEMKEKAIMHAHYEVINSLDFSADGRYLATGSADGVIKVWDVNDIIKNVAEMKVGHTIHQVSFAYHDYSLAVASDQKYVTLFDLKGLENGNTSFSSRLLDKHFYPVNTVKFTPDSLYLITGGSDNYLHLFDRGGRHIRKIDRLPNSVTTLSISPDSKVMVAMTEQSGVGRSYLLPSGEMQSEFTDHDNTVLSSAFSPESLTKGSYLVATAGGNHNEIYVWNALNGRHYNLLNGRGRGIWGMAFNQNDELLISNDPSVFRFEKSFNFKEMLAFNTSTKMDNFDLISFKNLGDYTVKVRSGKDIEVSPQNDGRALTNRQLTDGRVLVGCDFSLKAYNLKGQVVQEFLAHKGAVRALAVTSDGKYFASGGEDQVIHLWSLMDTAQQVKPFMSLFISKEDEWICWTKDGFFNASQKGGQLLAIADNKDAKEVAGGVVTVDQYYDILYRPNEFEESFASGIPVAEVMKAKGERILDITKLNKPPRTKFRKPYAVDKKGIRAYLQGEYDGEYVSDINVVTLPGYVLDQGGGVKELKIYHNDKLIIWEKGVEMPTGEALKEWEYDVQLLSGVNKFTTVALNQQGIESFHYDITIDYTGKTTAISDLYLFVVGINDYKKASYSLNYAYDDATSFLKKFKEVSTGIFNNVHVTEIYNTDAVKGTIEAKMNEVIGKAKLQDAFVFYYAGHGTLDGAGSEQTYYLCPTDITQLYGDSQQLKEKGISADLLKEWLSKVNAQKQLILLDACHSGEAVQTFARRGAPEEKAIVQLARSSGTVLISASGSKQFATEFVELKHGAFTYVLLEALSGKADGGDKDRKITVNELKAYMEDRVPQITQQYGDGKAQYPTGFISGQDFPIGVVEGEGDKE